MALGPWSALADRNSSSPWWAGKGTEECEPALSWRLLSSAAEGRWRLQVAVAPPPPLVFPPSAQCAEVGLGPLILLCAWGGCCVCGRWQGRMGRTWNKRAYVRVLETWPLLTCFQYKGGYHFPPDSALCSGRPVAVTSVIRTQRLKWI